VDRCWRGQRARRRAHRSLASSRSGAQKLTGGGATEGGKHGELGSGLTGARAALRKPGDGGAEWGGGSARVRGLLRRGEREIGAGRGAVKLEEGSRLL
jgi:hypothetical protein